MDEEQLVHWLRQAFPYRGEQGIGDDASVKRPDRTRDPGATIVAKDILVEGTHFDLAHASLTQVGEKAVGVNVSDMAAMGGRGEEIYLGLGFPGNCGEGRIREVFSGVRRGCRRWGLQLAGGDISRAPAWILSVTIIGHALRPVYRHGARHGDWIILTGRTGESALGLELLRRGHPDPLYSRRHLQVRPRVREGVLLGRLATAMIDVSDGLLKDLQRLLKASSVGGDLQVDAIPITRRMRECCRREGLDPLELALTGGEDFALLCTLPPKRAAELRPLRIPARIIGRVHASPGRLTLRRRGRVVAPPDRGGYDHFQAL